jgi:uncharacterized protein
MNDNVLNELENLLDQVAINFPWLRDSIRYAHIGGSHLYGSNTEQSDYDVRMIVCPPKDYWVGARTFEGTQVKSENIDLCIYDIRRWVHLAFNMNPNVIETLFVPEDKEIAFYCHHFVWDKLVKPRLLEQVSKAAYSGYKGYATAQLKQMVIKHGNKTGRRDIADQYGFDVKFASHGFRLLRQGAELLRVGRITFPRPDAQELLDIRTGKKYGPNELERCVADLTAEQQLLDEALVESCLPNKGNFEVINKLLQDIYDWEIT